jgi:hypothetical protein
VPSTRRLVVYYYSAVYNVKRYVWGLLTDKLRQRF